MKIEVVGRFVTRGTGPTGDGTVDLILGAGFKFNALKPNTVYQIKEIDGELLVSEVGQSCNMNKRAWNCDVNTVLTEQFPRALLSEAEAAALNDD